MHARAGCGWAGSAWAQEREAEKVRGAEDVGARGQNPAKTRPRAQHHDTTIKQFKELLTHCRSQLSAIEISHQLRGRQVASRIVGGPKHSASPPLPPPANLHQPITPAKLGIASYFTRK